MGHLARTWAFRRDRPEDWAVAGLRLMLLLGIALIWLRPVTYTYTTSAVLSLALAAGVAAGAVVGALPTPSRRHPRTAEAVWDLILLSYFLGHYLDLYQVWPMYDKTLHATNGVLGGLAAYVLARGTTWWWPRGAGTPGRVAFVVLSVVAMGAIVTELVEFGMDALFGTTEQTHPKQDGLTDTMMDLVAGTLGGGAAAAGAAWYEGRRPRPDHHPSAGVTSSRQG